MPAPITHDRIITANIIQPGEVKPRHSNKKDEPSICGEKRSSDHSKDKNSNVTGVSKSTTKANSGLLIDEITPRLSRANESSMMLRHSR
jgi:hypothetical protein